MTVQPSFSKSHYSFIKRNKKNKKNELSLNLLYKELAYNTNIGTSSSERVTTFQPHLPSFTRFLFLLSFLVCSERKRKRKRKKMKYRTSTNIISTKWIPFICFFCFALGILFSNLYVFFFFFPFRYTRKTIMLSDFIFLVLFLLMADWIRTWNPPESDGHSSLSLLPRREQQVPVASTDCAKVCYICHTITRTLINNYVISYLILLFLLIYYLSESSSRSRCGEGSFENPRSDSVSRKLVLFCN